ncbi:response regulator transcription factor [Peribacillus castrilensis]|uniref:response regulator transcription factor n=1 Tax=Bacillaceae TaxID=186817 RepID=UPI000C333951|nr:MULTISPECIES: response regulator transcription factor [Bacillaceae]MCK1982011.1 response regulator transcription factor [Peribacillus sp. Aquil_B1]MCK2007637.1 response regulator transcription factor [Peribacillus sp. Aquil_B8]PKF89061.1 DNA-binding response regulator [Bacillus sp. BA3]
MKTLLLVDDEARMLDLLNIYLSPVYHCIMVKSGHEAVVHMKNSYADLILLDVMMPEMDGWSTCAKIREFSKVPIIMLTARNEKSDVVKGFQLGADDYVTKPFDEGELLARIDALFRRMVDNDTKAVHFKGLKWDEESHELMYEGQEIQLTPKEFSLLGLLLKNPNKVFSRAHLLESIWENKAFTEDRTIDSHVRNIRDKLRQANFPIDLYLSTVWGVGYKWVPKE